jgi:hypothetical protein
MEQHTWNRECRRERGEVYRTYRRERQGVRWNSGEQHWGAIHPLAPFLVN